MNQNQTVGHSGSEFSLPFGSNRCHKKFIESSRIRNNLGLVSPPRSRYSKERSSDHSGNFAAKNFENEVIGTTTYERISYESVSTISDSHVLCCYRIRRRLFRLEIQRRFSHGQRYPSCYDWYAKTRGLSRRTTRSGESGLQKHNRHSNERYAESGRVRRWPTSPGWYGVPPARESESFDAPSWFVPLISTIQDPDVL